jgi:CRISPR-associated exonuclease Cas4
MEVTGTQLSYYFTCHRKLWLFGNGIQMEHNSELVQMGKLIHETSYAERPEQYQEVEIGPVKIDFYDKRNKVIHEVKKSDKLEESHQWQVKYYIFLMEQAGIEGVTGLLEYPKLRHTEEVLLTDRDRKDLESIIVNIEKIITSDSCPPLVKLGICKNCSYYDFCYSGED